MPVACPELRAEPVEITLPPDSHPETEGHPAILARLGLEFRYLFEDGRSTLRELAKRPANVWCALFLLNALVFPYASILHDAHLYSFQVLNALEGGAFNDDLFFHFGSQDRYTLFTPLVTPLARLVGLQPAFFLLYLVSIGLFLHALQRFVNAVIADADVATFALLFLASNPIAFGGLGIFHANESFLTPRLAANAMVLFGLEQMLRRHGFRAFACILVALALHPLMAAGGLAVFLGWVAVTRLPRTALGVAGATLVAGAVFVQVYEPLGTRLLGTMDDVWRDCVRRANPPLFPAAWTIGDWVQIGLAFGVCILGRRQFSDVPGVRRLVDVVLLVAALGLGESLLACEFLPYALLVQGQSWRALWLLQLVQIPLAFLLISRWWGDGTTWGRTGAILVLLYLVQKTATFEGMLAYVVALGAFVLVRGRHLGWSDDSRRLRTFWGCLALGLVCWILSFAVIAWQNWDQVAELYSPLEFARVQPQMLHPLYRLGFLLCLVALLWRWCGSSRSFRTGAIVLALGVQVFVFGLPFAEWYREKAQPLTEELRLVSELAQSQRGENPGRVTVYWPGLRPNYFWHELGVKSYFNYCQLWGNVFNRGTALEGQRRARLIGTLEVDNLGPGVGLLPPGAVRTMLDVLETTMEAPRPTRADLERLCQEPQLDFVILRRNFEGMAATAVGNWFVYDCASIRSRAGAAADLPRR